MLTLLSHAGTLQQESKVKHEDIFSYFPFMPTSGALLQEVHYEVLQETLLSCVVPNALLSGVQHLIRESLARSNHFTLRQEALW